MNTWPSRYQSEASTSNLELGLGKREPHLTLRCRQVPSSYEFCVVGERTEETSLQGERVRHMFRSERENFWTPHSSAFHTLMCIWAPWDLVKMDHTPVLLQPSPKVWQCPCPWILSDIGHICVLSWNCHFSFATGNFYSLRSRFPMTMYSAGGLCWGQGPTAVGPVGLRTWIVVYMYAFPH